MKIIFIKSFILILCFFIGNCAQSQTHLKLILNTTEPIDKAFVGHFTDKEFISIEFKDTLELDFKIQKTDFYHVNYLQGEKIYNVKLFLNCGSITVVMRIENDTLLVDKVSGSPFYEKVKKWKQNYTTIIQREDSAALDSFLLTTYEEQIDNIFSFSIGKKYLDIHQNNKLKLYALLPLIARQNDELKTQFGFGILNDRLLGIIRNNIISLSDFDLLDTENKTVFASTYNSRFTILDFWFVGCIPCIEDHKKIRELLPILKQKNIELISISNDDNYQTWKEYIEKNNYAWQHYKKPASPQNIVNQLGISSYPTYLLLDNEGKILHSTYSLEEVLSFVK
ncbi:MAG: TlpA disulfide reductase family protein [Chitinophagaceae bacterium]